MIYISRPSYGRDSAGACTWLAVRPGTAATPASLITLDTDHLDKAEPKTHKMQGWPLQNCGLHTGERVIADTLITNSPCQDAPVEVWTAAYPSTHSLTECSATQCVQNAARSQSLTFSTLQTSLISTHLDHHSESSKQYISPMRAHINGTPAGTRGLNHRLHWTLQSPSGCHIELLLSASPCPQEMLRTALVSCTNRHPPDKRRLLRILQLTSITLYKPSGVRSHRFCCQDQRILLRILTPCTLLCTS